MMTHTLQTPSDGVIGDYVRSHESFLKELDSEQPSWLRSIRSSGIAHFSEQGFPGTDQEKWKYTNLASLRKTCFPPVAGSEISEEQRVEILSRIPEKLEGERLVIVDGVHCGSLSERSNNLKFQFLPFSSMVKNSDNRVDSYLGRHIRHDQNPIVALNSAFIREGVFLEMPSGLQIEQPLHIFYVDTGKKSGSAVHLRHLFIAGSNSRVEIFEHYISLNESHGFTNVVTEVFVGENASLEHIKWQDQNRTSYHISNLAVAQESGSRFTSHSISTGAAISRNDIHIKLVGERTESFLYGLYLGRGNQLVDHHTVVDHLKPNSESEEIYHGILCEKSHGVFNGRIHVHSEAQKTNAKQSNRNLLLSRDSWIDTKPELEIYADDVRCTHGATVGQMDEQAVFYLRARGPAARRILVGAFAGEITQRIPLASVRQSLQSYLLEELSRIPLEICSR